MRLLVLNCFKKKNTTTCIHASTLTFFEWRIFRFLQRPLSSFPFHAFRLSTFCFTVGPCTGNQDAVCITVHWRFRMSWFYSVTLSPQIYAFSQTFLVHVLVHYVITFVQVRSCNLLKVNTFVFTTIQQYRLPLNRGIRCHCTASETFDPSWLLCTPVYNLPWVEPAFWKGMYARTFVQRCNFF